MSDNSGNQSDVESATEGTLKVELDTLSSAEEAKLPVLSSSVVASSPMPINAVTKDLAQPKGQDEIARIFKAKMEEALVQGKARKKSILAVEESEEKKSIKEGEEAKAATDGEESAVFNEVEDVKTADDAEKLKIADEVQELKSADDEELRTANETMDTDVSKELEEADAAKKSEEAEAAKDGEAAVFNETEEVKAVDDALELTADDEVEELKTANETVGTDVSREMEEADLVETAEEANAPKQIEETDTADEIEDTKTAEEIEKTDGISTSESASTLRVVSSNADSAELTDERQDVDMSADIPEEEVEERAGERIHVSGGDAIMALFTTTEQAAGDAGASPAEIAASSVPVCEPPATPAPRRAYRLPVRNNVAVKDIPFTNSPSTSILSKLAYFISPDVRQKFSCVTANRARFYEWLAKMLRRETFHSLSEVLALGLPARLSIEALLKSINEAVASVLLVYAAERGVRVIHFVDIASVKAWVVDTTFFIDSKKEMTLLLSILGDVLDSVPIPEDLADAYWVLREHEAIKKFIKAVNNRDEAALKEMNGLLVQDAKFIMENATASEEDVLAILKDAEAQSAWGGLHIIFGRRPALLYSVDCMEKIIDASEAFAAHKSLFLTTFQTDVIKGAFASMSTMDLFKLGRRRAEKPALKRPKCFSEYVLTPGSFSDEDDEEQFLCELIVRSTKEVAYDLVRLYSLEKHYELFSSFLKEHGPPALLNKKTLTELLMDTLREMKKFEKISELMMSNIIKMLRDDQLDRETIEKYLKEDPTEAMTLSSGLVLATWNSFFD